MIIHTKAYSRVGLVGNPSDGYFGKTISVIVKNYSAEVTLYETPRLRIVPAEQDSLEYDSMQAMASDIAWYGYYGGVRLVKAAIKRFLDYCAENSFELDSRNFSIEYRTDIPQRVGLAGSSAIITATLRALMTFYGVTIPKPLKANLALSVETDELGLPAGLQDRVIQAYEGCVFMDFDRQEMERRGYGRYEPIDPALLPPLYVASVDYLAEGTEVFHSNIRERWELGEVDVLEAMKGFAQCAEEVRELLVAGRGAEIGPILDRNYDIRASIYRISEQNAELIRLAREAGASAKFAGSGGAIVGAYPDEATFERLHASLSKFGATVVKPIVQ
jgi:glucuronokinase